MWKTLKKREDTREITVEKKVENEGGFPQENIAAKTIHSFPQLVLKISTLVC